MVLGVRWGGVVLSLVLVRRSRREVEEECHFDVVLFKNFL